MNKKNTGIINEFFLFLTQNPAFIGFSSAIIGVFIGGLISFYSLKYSKEIDFEITRKNHVEQLYLNLEFSFSLFKDRLIHFYLNDWEAVSNEKIFKLQGISSHEKNFYEKKFLTNLNKIDSDKLLLSESMASFNRDYKALKLYINLQPFDRYFESTFDNNLLIQISYLKKIPAETFEAYNSTQIDSIDKILDTKISELHKNSDSVLAIINKLVSVEINK